MGNCFRSKASPFHWRIESGDMTFTGGLPDMNFLAEDLPVEEQMACQQVDCDFIQCWECGDQTVIQFTWGAGPYDTLAPYLILYNEDGTIVDQWFPADFTQPAADTWYVVLDFADYDCPGCYYLEILSVLETEGANLFLSGHTGDFEGAPFDITGGGQPPFQNTAVSSGAQNHTVFGVNSLQITAPALRNTTTKLAWHDSSSITLTSGTIYRAEAWVYQEVGNPWMDAVDGTIWMAVNHDGSKTQNPAVLKGWTDAIILSQNSYNYGTDGEGVWIYIQTTFRVGAVVTGYLGMETEITPEIAGIIYTDDIKIVEIGAGILEATSENFQVAHECSCREYPNLNTVGVLYGPDMNVPKPQFGFYYDNSFSVANFIRLPFNWAQFEMRDPDFKMDDDSILGADVVISAHQKIYKCWTDPIPWWMIEKIPMIMKFDRIEFQYGVLSGNGIEMVCIAPTFETEWLSSKGTCGRLKWEMRLKEYEYQNKGCGA